MERSARLFLFGDQTASFDTDIRQLLQVKDNVILTAFLKQAHVAIRDEISKLPPRERELFPRSTSVVELLSKHGRKTNPALESTLTAICELGCFMR
jgi:naphtho-gamma-pyrone polyketide synthase